MAGELFCVNWCLCGRLRLAYRFGADGGACGLGLVVVRVVSRGRLEQTYCGLGWVIPWSWFRGVDMSRNCVWCR